MKVLTPKQSQPGETRVALVPAVVKKLVARGIEVTIEAGAGRGAHHRDAAYEAAGATIVEGDAATVWSAADVVVTLHPPTAEQATALQPGAVLMGTLQPLKHLDAVRALADRNVTAFSMEFVPRISRAQAMDVLSSQANIGGYMAVIIAARACPKMFPMMMTAAGTIAPAKVFVIGAGVAGLQAIATAKRLGAVVEAYDVRPVVKEQVQSLGARFVDLAIDQADAETAGGYAKEQTDEQRRQQAERMAKHIIGADCVIATAAVFGKAPPMIVPGDVVDRMSPGSVLVDLAADPEAGRGNCERTTPGERIETDRGAVIDGTLNLPALVPVHASQMYAANMLAFLDEILDKGEGEDAAVRVKIDLEDEVQRGAAITHDGRIVNDLVAGAAG